MLVVPFIILMYVLPTVAGLAAYGHWDTWATWPETATSRSWRSATRWEARRSGWRSSASALLGNLALYLDYLASGARPLFAIAADGLFPKASRASAGAWARPWSPSC